MHDYCERLIKTFLLLAFSISLGYALNEEDYKHTYTVRYFGSPKDMYSDELNSIHNDFRSEMYAGNNPYKNVIIVPPKTKINYRGCYKVYYDGKIPVKAEKIKYTGYYFDIKKGKIEKDTNGTEETLGVVYKYDKKGRNIYRTDGENTCRVFYGLKFREIICTGGHAGGVTKFYYQNNQVKIIVEYHNGKIYKYSTSEGSYDKDGKPLKYHLNSLKKNYEKYKDRLSERFKEDYKEKIEEAEKKIKNTPIIDLTLVKEYIKGIDNLNKEFLKTIPKKILEPNDIIKHRLKAWGRVK